MKCLKVGIIGRWRRKLSLIVAVCALATLTARAQWMTQRINLVEGWNAIHLKVNPVDTSCATVFSPDAYPTAITQVSWWNRDRLDDGTGSAITDFCNWYRSVGEPSTFQRVIGDQRYLVYSTRPFALDVVGTPAIPSGTIYLGEYNLVGVNVPNLAGEDAPTYFEYFAPFYYRSPSWYGVTPANEKLRLANSVQATDASKAVWLETTGSGMTSFTGPFLLSLGNAEKVLSWTDDASLVRTLTVKNSSNDDRVLEIALASSLTPPTGHGTMTGNVALLRETTDWSGGFANTVYVPFLNDSATSFTTNIAAGATFELRLKPDTSRMPASEGNYMGILEISDKGSTISGELRPEGTCLYRVGAFASGSLAASDVSSKAGLWVGTVVLAQVNRAKTLSSAEPAGWNSTNLVTAPHTFQFRLLVHVDAEGNAKLLKESFTATKVPDGDAYLLADRATAVAFRGEYPNGTIRRTSSANFPFIEPLALTGGSFTAGGDTIGATFTQQYDDKTNPFVHSFHPQHDNVEFNNQKPSKLGDGDEGVGEYESWGVTREISLTFANADPVSANVEWNRTVTGGIYEETVSGLTGQGKPIVTRGAFRLTKVNDAKRIYSGGLVP